MMSTNNLTFQTKKTKTKNQKKRKGEGLHRLLIDVWHLAKKKLKLAKVKRARQFPTILQFALPQKESCKRSLAKEETKKMTEASEKVTKKLPKESQKRKK